MVPARQCHVRHHGGAWRMTFEGRQESVQPLASRLSCITIGPLPCFTLHTSWVNDLLLFCASVCRYRSSTRATPEVSDRQLLEDGPRDCFWLGRLHSIHIRMMLAPCLQQAPVGRHVPQHAGCCGARQCINVTVSDTAIVAGRQVVRMGRATPDERGLPSCCTSINEERPSGCVGC